MKFKILRAWVPALLWIGVIIVESFAGSSENTAPFVRKFLEFFFGPLNPHLFDVLHSYLRKGGHFFGYAVQSFALYRAWWVTLRAHSHPDRLRWRDMLGSWSARAMVLALLGTFAVAGLDELHQSLVRTRTGHFRDVLLDEMGAWLAQIAILLSSLGPKRRAGRATPLSGTQPAPSEAGG